MDLYQLEFFNYSFNDQINDSIDNPQGRDTDLSRGLRLLALRGVDDLRRALLQLPRARPLRRLQGQPRRRIRREQQPRGGGDLRGRLYRNDRSVVDQLN